ncbi:MAG: HAMP domain-containing histidine kinase [Gammaproteobacteria bacterium]|nr:HAMP domain-containing histidine kinase [Gammaproteobacteria bacterium]
MSTQWPMRRRLMLGFAIFALVVATLFSGYAMVFTYAVEDQFFVDALRYEATVQRAHHARTGHWMQPRLEYMSVHEDPSSFPPDLREQYRRTPMRSENAGDAGRHYHLLRLSPAGEGSHGAFLVAEVSQQLVVRRYRNDLLQLLAWSAVGVVGLALLVGYWLARRTAAPLVDLAQRVETMQPNDPPPSFVGQFSPHEIGVLAKGLDSLAARVHAFVAREREFTRDASHELRTPLAVMHSACERLAQDGSLSVEARRQVECLRQSAWQLQQTVTTLLSLAREENAGLQAETVAVLPLLEHVVVEYAPLLEGKPVEVRVDVPREARMTLPPPVLRIVLGNLVGNAFAHTSAGQVCIDVDGGRLRIANTEAMDSEVRDALDRPFTKRQASTGYGLGFAIVRRLCERYGIDLRLETDPLGTTMSLALDSTGVAI